MTPPTSGTYEFAIASNGAVLSTGLVAMNRIPLPTGVSVQYPNGTTLTVTQGKATSATASLSFSASTLTQGQTHVQIPLELVVIEPLGTPGQADLVAQTFTVTVNP